MLVNYVKSLETSRRYDSIDDFLGPSSGRFFGSGYKTSGYEVHLTASSADFRSFVADIDLTIGENWSIKGLSKQLPHVSTTDIIALALNLSERCLERAELAGRDDLLLSEMQIRGPVKPAEGNSYTFEGHCKVTDGPVMIETNSRMLGFSIRSRFQKVGKSPALRHPDFPTLALWRDGFKLSTNRIENVRIDSAAHVAVADFDHISAVTSEWMTGIDSAFQKYPSLIDVFASAMQLGQSLIYDLDTIDRATSNTLWMRTLSIQTDPDLRPQFRKADGLQCVIKKTALLPDDDAHNWRSVLLEMGIVGVSMQCSVVHKIPRK